MEERRRLEEEGVGEVEKEGEGSVELAAAVEAVAIAVDERRAGWTVRTCAEEADGGWTVAHT